MKKVNSVDGLKPHMKKIANEAKFFMSNPSAFRISMLGPDEQISAIKDFEGIIRIKFGNVAVQVYISETPDIFDPAQKAIKSRPMKPAIYIEWE